MGGRRLLALIANQHAETNRRRQRDRQHRIDGSLGDQVRLAGDALVDVVAGRTPRIWTLVAQDSRLVGGELRRRLRGSVSSRSVQEALLLRHEDGYALRILDAAWSGPLADPVLTLRAVALVLDGQDAGTLRGGHPEAISDLDRGVLRLGDDDALRRRPEGLVTLARLAARPELQLTDRARQQAHAAFASGAFAEVRQSRLWFALDDLLAAPEAIEALELLRDLSAPTPLHDSARVDGDLLRRADALLPGGASRALMLVLGVLHDATRSRVAAFMRRDVRFDGPEALAVIAAAGPQRRPRWA